VPDVVVHDPTAMPAGDLEVAVVEACLARPDGLAHDPERLAAVLARLVP